MGRFLTEKTIEDFLTDDVRVLPMSDGGAISVCAFKLTWVNYDIVLKHGPLSAPEITALMLFYAGKTDMETRYALRDVLAPLRKVADKVLDKEIALLKRRIAMRKALLGSFGKAVRGAVQPGEAKDPRDRISPLVFRSHLGPQGNRKS